MKRTLTLTISLTQLPASRLDAMHLLLHPIRSAENIAYFVVDGAGDDVAVTFERAYTPQLEELVAQGRACVFWLYAHVLPNALQDFVQGNRALLERVALGLHAGRQRLPPFQAVKIAEEAQEAEEELERALEALRADPNSHVMIWVPVELFNGVAGQFLGQDDQSLAKAVRQLLGDDGIFEHGGRYHWCDPQAALSYAMDVRDGRWPATRYDDHHLVLPCGDAKIGAVLEWNLRPLFELAFPGVSVTCSDAGGSRGPHLGLMGQYLGGLMPTPEAFQALLRPVMN